MNNDYKGEIIIYQTEEGLSKIDVKVENETVWLSLDQMADLFQRDKSTISRHIRNVFSDGELSKDSVVANFATTATDGKKLDLVLTSSNRKLLKGSGKTRHDKAIEKARNEHQKYQVKPLSPVEKEYLNSLKQIEEKV